jgi:hypothetical protein
MISRKTLGILVGILVVLAVLSTVTRRSRYSTAEDGGFVTILGDSLDPASVQEIEAWLGSDPEEPVVLERSGDGWVVKSRWGWKAKPDMVKRLLDDFSGLQGELRASSEDVLTDFQADDEGGLHIVAKGSGGGELFHLVAGKSSIRGGTFVRKEGSDRVYLTQAGLRSSFGLWGEEPTAPDPKRWIELRVNQTDRTDVDRIVVRDEGSEIVLEKEFPMITPEPAAADSAAADSAAAASPPEPQPDRHNWTWKPDASGEFDKAKVDGILGTLCSLYAFDVADPDSAEAYGLTDPERSVEITLASGDTVSVVFGGTTDDGQKTYFRLGQDGKPAVIYTTTVDRIFQSRKDLKPQA